MNPLDIELARLTITAYANREMTERVGSIEATCNPETIDLNYRIDYQAEGFVNNEKAVSRYLRLQPGDLTLDLVFDAKLPDDTEPVQKQIDRLIHLCCALTGKENEPKQPSYLKVTWGKLKWGAADDYRGYVTSLKVSYTLFKNSGKPLRAIASLSLVALESLAVDAMAPPDRPLPSVAVAPDLADLAWIAAKAGLAGTSKYVQIADANDCDNLDDFQPGDTLVYNEEGAP